MAFDNEEAEVIKKSSKNNVNEINSLMEFYNIESNNNNKSNDEEDQKDENDLQFAANNEEIDGIVVNNDSTDYYDSCSDSDESKSM